MYLNINSHLNSVNMAQGSSGNLGINKNSEQYKAVVRDSMASIMENESMMSEKERLIYETFGGRDAIIRNKMRMYDSSGNLLNGFGVAGMCANGIPMSQRHKIIGIAEDDRQKMFDEALRHFKQENGVANGDTTNRSEIFTKFQLSIPIEDRLKGTWTLEQYEKQYRQAFADACRKADPEWKLGKDIPSGALDGITRESIDNRLIKVDGEYGETFAMK